MSQFSVFSATAESVGATQSRLEKARILGEYFQTLTDADLSRAALYFAGYLFPQRDGRVAQIGGAAIGTALQIVTGAQADWLNERVVARGDWGDVAREAFESWPAASQNGVLRLEDLEKALATLATTSGTKNKIALVSDVLRLCLPIEAKFWVKMLQGDLRIGLKEGAVEDALARLSGQSVAQIQRANMLTGDIGQTALLVRHERLSEAQFGLFHPLKFMLATPAADLSQVARLMPETFVVEDKFDGIRAQAHIGPHLAGDEILHGQTSENHRVALFSRTLDEITGAFPDLLAPLAALLPAASHGLVLDGEIVPIAGEKILPFQDLQKRLGRKTPGEAVLAQIPVAFIAYDALFNDGEILLEAAFSRRRTVLESLDWNATARLSASRSFAEVEALDAEFDAARARGNEGLMVKDPRAWYKPGRRGREWLKIKRALATLDVVVTAVEAGSGRRSRFYSDYTFAVRASETDATLLNIGKAYSGLTDDEISTLNEWFLAHTLQTFAHGKVRLVEPKIVLEIAFDRVQPSPRHKSGFALRFPRIVRLREDKPMEEIDTLETVQKMAEI